MKIFNLLLFIVVIGLTSVAKAEKIIFPEEELAKEWALPVFDQVTTVRSRSVMKSQRFEFIPTFGFSLAEPFYSSYMGGAALLYHFSEDNAFRFEYFSWTKGLSTYSEQLDKCCSTMMKYTPGPSSLMLLNYVFTGYYGKISLTKKSVMPTHTFITGGLGSLTFQGMAFPSVSVGLGTKFYFTPNIAMNFDFRLLIGQGPNPNAPKGKLNTNLTAPTPPSEFEKQTQVRTLLSVGLAWLI